MNQPHPSPLRYPGGKTSLAPFLCETICDNGLEGGTYIEPFAGGAGAALTLLFSEHISEIYINDKDPRLFAFWKAILDRTDEFLALLASSPISVRMWKHNKTILRQPYQHSLLEIGFATFYLNRCNHSGALNGGPIGGMSQDGPYKIHARFDKEQLRRRIQKIALYKDRIKVSNLDGVTFLRRIFDRGTVDKENCLVYMDPPYFEKARKLYSYYFREADHIRLATYLNQEADYRWIVSYDDSRLVQKLYSGPKSILLMKYSFRSVRLGRELIISSTRCSLPRSALAAYSPRMRSR